MTPASPDDLRALMSGDLVLPGDERWDAARRAWNLAVDQRPEMVALPASADDVVAVVDFARRAGLQVAPQTTGHGGGAYGSLEGAVLLRSSGLTGVALDPDGRRARVGAGTLWGQVAEPASEHGLASLAGSSPSVGIAGYTLGGGLGWLARRHGLACNGLLSADVVTADGRKLRADRDSEPELFWALRGGGGSFAAVTALEFELFPAPELFGGIALWPWERCAEVLGRWAEWAATVPDEVTSVGRLLQVPPLAQAPEPLRGRSFVGVEAAYLGGEAEGAKLVAPLRELGPEVDTFASIPPAGLAALHMDPPEPVPGVGGHVMLAELPAQAVDALTATAGPGSGSPLVSVELRQLGGALAEPRADAGALAKLEGAYALFGVGMAAGPEAVAAIRAQLGRIRLALDPWTGGHRYLNFVEDPTDAGELFDGAIYERLREVKGRHDPDDVFRGNHAIAPP